MVDIQLPEGAAMDRTVAVQRKAYEIISAHPAVNNVMAVAGFSMVGGDGANFGMMIVGLNRTKSVVTRQCRFRRFWPNCNRS